MSLKRYVFHSQRCPSYLGVNSADSPTSSREGIDRKSRVEPNQPFRFSTQDLVVTPVLLGGKE